MEGVGSMNNISAFQLYCTSWFPRIYQFMLCDTILMTLVMMMMMMMMMITIGT